MSLVQAHHQVRWHIKYSFIFLLNKLVLDHEQID